MGQGWDEVKIGVSRSTHPAEELCNHSKRIPKDFRRPVEPSGGDLEKYEIYGFYIDQSRASF
jgi:hypothetical protein